MEIKGTKAELSGAKAELRKQIKEAKRQSNELKLLNKQLRFIGIPRIIRFVVEGLIELAPYERGKEMCLALLEGKSLEDIAAQHNLSKERTRQIICCTIRLCIQAYGRQRDRLMTFEILESNNKQLRKRVAHLESQLKDYQRLGSLSDNVSERSILETPVTELGFSVRLLNCLKTANIEYLYQLTDRSRIDLLRYRNFGRRSLMELDEFFKKNNLLQYFILWK